MNTLIEDALLSTKHVNHAAIIKIKDGVVKARSSDFSMSPSDWESIQKAFSNPREVRIQDAGIVLMNVGYRAIRADNMAVYGKNGKVGVIICRTHQYYILGTYDSGMYPSIAAEAVEKLADYLRKKNK